MSDREQLAARLVEAAARQVLKDEPVLIHFHWSAEAVARPALAAGLRELDEAVMERVVAGRDPIDLSGLADYIEKGAGDG